MPLLGIVMTMVPLALLAGASIIMTPAYLVGRTDVACLVPFALLLGWAGARAPRWIIWFALTVWFLVAPLSLASTYGLRKGGKGADRSLAERLTSMHLGSDDWLVHTWLTAPSLEYYLYRWGIEHRTAWFPPEAAHNPAAIKSGAGKELQYMRAAEQLRLEIMRGAQPGSRVFMVALVAPQADIQAGEAVDFTVLGYPSDVLLFALLGERRVRPSAFYHQDWIGGRRLLLSFPAAEIASEQETIRSSTWKNWLSSARSAGSAEAGVEP